MEVGVKNGFVKIMRLIWKSLNLLLGKTKKNTDNILDIKQFPFLVFVKKKKAKQSLPSTNLKM